MVAPANTPNGKYALLVTNETVIVGERVCADGGRIALASVDTLFRQDIKSFRADFGARTLAQIAGSRVVFMIARPAVAPGVGDHENEALMRLARWAWYAYQLSRPRVPAIGKHSWIFSGEAHLGTQPADTLPVTVKSFEMLHKLYHPHVGHDDYVVGPDHDWPDRMRAIYDAIIDALDASGELPRYADAGMVSYSNALRLDFVDLRVPFFVRSAECILALPRRATPAAGTGALEFARRGSLFLAGLNDAFLGNANLQTMLREIFQLRNDCVHGKIVEEELRARQQLGNEHRYQYLAEILAERTTNWAIRHPALLRQLPTRIDLENAWASGTIQQNI